MHIIHYSVTGNGAPSGTRGANAQTYWSVIDTQGRVVEGPAADRFCPSMSFLRFFDDNDDAIFEPGSLITFPMFTWTNQGGLSCPAGGVRSFTIRNRE